MCDWVFCAVWRDHQMSGSGENKHMINRIDRLAISDLFYILQWLAFGSENSYSLTHTTVLI